MKKIILCSLAAILSLSGCATTNTKTSANEVEELRIQVTQLETELAEKDRMLFELQDELSSKAKTSSTNIAPSQSIKFTTKRIQTALKNAGFYNGSVDGKLGPQTKKAIKDFQSANGLKVDGIAGPRTKKALTQYLN